MKTGVELRHLRMLIRDRLNQFTRLTALTFTLLQLGVLGRLCGSRPNLRRQDRSLGVVPIDRPDPDNVPGGALVQNGFNSIISGRKYKALNISVSIIKSPARKPKLPAPPATETSPSKKWSHRPILSKS